MRSVWWCICTVICGRILPCRHCRHQIKINSRRARNSRYSPRLCSIKWGTFYFFQKKKNRQWPGDVRRNQVIHQSSWADDKRSSSSSWQYVDELIHVKYLISTHPINTAPNWQSYSERQIAILLQYWFIYFIIMLHEAGYSSSRKRKRGNKSRDVNQDECSSDINRDLVDCLGGHFQPPPFFRLFEYRA